MVDTSVNDNTLRNFQRNQQPRVFSELFICDASATPAPVPQRMPTDFPSADVLDLSANNPSYGLWLCCLLQPLTQRKLQASGEGSVGVSVPGTLLRSAFGGDWQQAGFTVQLTVLKDSARVAGRRVAAKQGPCSAAEVA
jgi:hypothetical protein